MQGIILKCKSKISPAAHQKMVDIISAQWLGMGIMLLPEEIDLVGVISDEKDTNIVLCTEEVITNDKSPKIAE